MKRLICCLLVTSAISAQVVSTNDREVTGKTYLKTIRSSPRELVIAGQEYRWPQLTSNSPAIIPYVISLDAMSSNSPSESSVQAAIDHVNVQIPGLIHLVPRTSESAYIVFKTYPNWTKDKNPCESKLGRQPQQFQPQDILLTSGCLTHSIVHEIGHAIGLIHEHQRPDRDAFVSVHSANIKCDLKNFELRSGMFPPPTQPYDYFSIMHYGTGTGCATEGNSIDPVVAEIPLGNGESSDFSSGDLLSIKRAYGFSVEGTTITSTPPGLQMTVDGVNFTTPAIFQWPAGSTHTFAPPSPQNLSTYPVPLYFTGWSAEGGLDPRVSQTITVSPDTPLYIANFRKATAGKLIRPVSGAIITAPSATFVWKPGTGVIEHELILNAVAGPFIAARHNIPASADSIVVDGLPTDTVLHVKFRSLLSTIVGPQWSEPQEFDVRTCTDCATVPLVSVTPVSGSTATENFTFTYTHPQGWTSFSILNVLVNDFLDANRSCYLAYDRASNVLYLVNDSATALLPGLVMNGTGSTSNSQCMVDGNASAVLGSGTTLTLKLAITFRSSFGGNRVIYLAARDTAGGNTGWRNAGVRSVPGRTYSSPAVVGSDVRDGDLSPKSLTFNFADDNGWQNLDVVNILVNSALDGANACYVAYSRPYNVVYLVNDSGNGLLPGLVLNGSGGISNGQCSITGAGSEARGDGNTLVLTLQVNFSASFKGGKIMYLASRNLTSGNSGWQAFGAFEQPQ